MNFLFACGGTAGHINPAIALAQKLGQLMPDANFLFIGAEGMMETELVPREGYEIREITVSNLARHGGLAMLRHNAEAIREVFTASEQAKKILLEKEIDILVHLNDGEYSSAAWGCDLTYDYVKINGDYRS